MIYVILGRSNLAFPPYLLTFFHTDTPKTEKQTDFSLRFDELQYQISKLKEELSNARKEIKDLKDNSELKIEKLTTQVEQIQNMTQQGTTRNDTSQVS